MRFKNRYDAAVQLLRTLEHYKAKDVVVYAIPRGGVPLGAVVAQGLNAPLDLIVTRKIGHPMDAEYAIAAVSDDGELVKNEHEVSAVDQKWFQEEVLRRQVEAQERRQKYVRERHSASVAGKIAIVVDDGLATGLTMKVALMSIRKRNPARVVVAIPIASRETVENMKQFADEVVALYAPEFFVAVGEFYNDFPQVTDEEVMEYL